MPDPLEHFEDQQYSHDLLQQNTPALREAARNFVAESPGVEPVGLILDAGASEAQAFAEALERAAGRKLDVPGFLGVVPRPFALQILRLNCPAALDNLPDSELGQTLPVLIATKGGYRFAVVDYSI